MLMKEPLRAGLSQLLTRSIANSAVFVSTLWHAVADVVQPPLEKARGFLSWHLPTTLTVVRLCLGLASAFALNAKDY
jgi:hypothetical protein